MRSEADWTRWGNRHPFLASIAQLGIYALCWIAVLACLGILAGLFALLARYGP